MWFKNIHIFCPDKFRNGALRIVQITRDACFGGTIVHTGRIQPFFYSVKTEGAFVDDMLVGMEVTAAVRAGLNAIFASDTILLVHQHDALICFEGGTYRTNLYARGFVTMVTHLWHKEGFLNLLSRY